MTTRDDALRFWPRVLGAMEIETTRTLDGVSVTRTAQSRYVVTVDGQRREFGGRNTHFYTAYQLTLNFLLNEAKPLLCIKCQLRPRVEGKSWCQKCFNAQSLVAMRKLRRKAKAARFAAIVEGTK